MQLNSLKNRIIEKAQKLGACLAGIINVEILKESPSHEISEDDGKYRNLVKHCRRCETTCPVGAAEQK